MEVVMEFLNQYSKDDILMILAAYYKTERIRSRAAWDAERGSIKFSILPYSYMIMDKLKVESWEEVQFISRMEFEKWKDKLKTITPQIVRKELQQRIMRKAILLQLEPYKKDLTTIKAYTEFRNRLLETEGISLPSTGKIILYFDSWNNLKEELQLDAESNGKLIYTDEELINILIKYKNKLTPSNWEYYVEHEGIPYLSTFTRRLGKDVVNQYVNPSRHKTAEETLKLLWEHRSNLISVRKWNQYASEHNLPSYTKIYRTFDTQTVNTIKEYLNRPDATFEGLKKIVTPSE